MRVLHLGKLALCVAAFAAYAAIGLSVSRLEGVPRWVRNGAERVPGGGLRVSSPGMVRSRQPPIWLGDAIRGSELQIDLRVRAHAARQCGPARIFSISHSTSLRNLTIAQQESDLVLRLRTPATSLNGEPPYKVPAVFADGRSHEILLTLEGRRLALAVDGRQVLEDELPAEPLRSWDPTCLLYLANEGGGFRPWLGDLERAEVRAGESRLDYARGEDLEAPSGYLALGSSPRCDGPATDGGWSDGAVNLIGFAPLGLLVALMWRRLSPGWVTLLCGCLSLSIEASQFFVTGRSPDVLDLLLNTAGAAAGAFIGRRFARRPL